MGKFDDWYFGRGVTPVELPPETTGYPSDTTGAFAFDGWYPPGSKWVEPTDTTPGYWVDEHGAVLDWQAIENQRFGGAPILTPWKWTEKKAVRSICTACEGFGMKNVFNGWDDCAHCDGVGYFDVAPQGQSRAMSFGETVFSTAVGFVVALATQAVVFPLFGLHATFAENFWIAGIFTVVSVIRGYGVRRLFEAWR